MHRISYWLVSGGGLAREDIPWVTADQANLNNSPPAVPDPSMGSVMLAAEVRNLQFSYFDGTQWNDSWDGTQLGSDGVTPIGYPLAIAVTMDIAPLGKGEDEEAPVTTYRHVVPIMTANGATAVTPSTQQSSSTQQNSSTGGTTP
jgi:hypothetical protein